MTPPPLGPRHVAYSLAYVFASVGLLKDLHGYALGLAVYMVVVTGALALLWMQDAGA